MIRVIARRDGQDHELEVDADGDVTSASTLARELDPEATGDLDVAGRRVSASTLLRDAGIRDGQTIRALTPAASQPTGRDEVQAPTPRPDAVRELHVVGGLTAGARVPLPPGAYVLGRDRTADVPLASPTVSSSHCRLTVTQDGSCTVEDLGSHNGTRVDGAFVARPRALLADQLLELGSVQIRLRTPRRATAVPPLPRPGSSRVAFNRPPRPAPPEGPAPVVVPEATRTDAQTPGLPWTAMLIPLVVGIGLAVLIDPRMAVFTLLSPLMLLGNWFEERRKAKRGDADRRADRDRRTSRFRDDLASAADAVLRQELRLGLDPAEAVTRATTYDARLWERRPDDHDRMRVRLGLGARDLALPLTYPATDPDDATLDLARAAAQPAPAPVTADLAAGRSVGVVGERDAVLAVQRWIVSATATQHGPADVRVAILTDRPQDWSWASWLPHTVDPWREDRRLLAGTPDEHRDLLDLLDAPADAGDPVVLLVLDAPDLTHGRGATARELLRGSGRAIAGLVRADHRDHLPETITEVLELDGVDGRARWSEPGSGNRVDELVATGVSVATARRVAVALAGLEDPEATVAGGDLPGRVDLLPLLGLDTPTAEGVRRRWADDPTRPATPIGAGDDGIFELDLVRDGPHGLLGGTTGSGKSELLRTLVAGLAASCHPDHLNLVLIDYKGGSAFDACARLPHTVGLVTDLDDHLAARALTCLEAELRTREHQLRRVGADDLPAYLAAGHGEAEPMPRLLVVIDEFAALANELPEFVSALVDIAQRGRSLGVHLLLATQRPSGVISDNIRANTNLRVALRVQDEADSRDVLNAPDAALIGRDQPGRGLVRLGPSELEDFQTALVTGRSNGSAGGSGVALHPVTFGVRSARPQATTDGSGPTDLERLVDACREAAADVRPPRLPWPPPLPDHLSPETLPALPERRPGTALLGLADEPHNQRQVPFTLDVTAGSVAIYGVAASGTGRVLATVALDLARHHHPDGLHLHVLDLGASGLAPLGDLPHVGAYVGSSERERQERLLSWVVAEVERRRAAAGTGRGEDPQVVILLDNYTAFAKAYDDVASFALRDAFERTIVDGPAVGVVTILTADRPGALPTSVGAGVTSRLVLQLADPFDRVSLGLASDDVPPAIPGRAVEVSTAREVQIALTDDLTTAVATVASPGAVARPPARIGTLPQTLAVDEVLGATRLDRSGWLLPLGLADDDLSPAGLDLGPGDHALIVGPSRSGRSTALAVAAVAALRSPGPVAVTAVAPRGGPLVELPDVRVVEDLTRLPELIAELGRAEGPQLVLLDDAELVDDTMGALKGLLDQRRDDLHLVAAGRVDALRSSYAPWLSEVKRTRIGLALRPNPDTDGFLWDTALPRKGPATWPVGRGYLVREGNARMVQVACP